VAIALVAMLLALLWPPLTIILDLLMLLLWAIPDQRIERHLMADSKKKSRQ
ncbi:MAG: TMEM175 family protein, partial [Lacticaseibacillus paracasei]